MNLYKRLIGLLPSTPLQVGNVVSVNGGVATVSMPGGGIDTARGDATVGQRVFFQGGVIQAVAPSLPVEIIEI